MKRTKKLPTKVGYYWCWPESYLRLKPEPMIMKVFWKGDELLAKEYGSRLDGSLIRAYKGSYFKGPLKP